MSQSHFSSHIRTFGTVESDLTLFWTAGRSGRALISTRTHERHINNWILMSAGLAAKQAACHHYRGAREVSVQSVHCFSALVYGHLLFLILFNVNCRCLAKIQLLHCSKV